MLGPFPSKTREQTEEGHIELALLIPALCLFLEARAEQHPGPWSSEVAHYLPPWEATRSKRT